MKFTRKILISCIIIASLLIIGKIQSKEELNTDNTSFNINNYPRANIQEMLIENGILSVLNYLSLSDYIENDPISISGNANILSHAQNEGWSGNGSIDNPIVIENLNITNSETIHMITLSNIDLFIEIQNNFLNGVNGAIKEYGDGIWLNNVANCQINANIIQSNAMGISLEPNNRNINISDNSIFDNVGTGIHLYQSSSILIRNNLIFQNLLRGNFPSANGDGIEIDDSSNVNISNNYIYSNEGNGISIRDSTDTISSQNTIQDNTYGIYMTDSSSRSRIESNIIVNNSITGIYLRITSKIFLENNLIANNSENGIKISNSLYKIETINNIINNNGFFGIKLFYCTNSKIVSNYIFNNENGGISFERSNNNNIWNNTFYNNSFFGIELDTTSIGNQFYLNIFKEKFNGQNYVKDNSGSNNWSNGTHGNYWCDYTGSDSNGDGIGDSPYLLSDGASVEDPHPLVDIHICPQHTFQPTDTLETTDTENTSQEISETDNTESSGFELFFFLFGIGCLYYYQRYLKQNN
ncbi:MAG: right-handed parallel beta-helix repeat-containing protein [Candidatus Hodarchaeales archaeon]